MRPGFQGEAQGQGRERVSGAEHAGATEVMTTMQAFLSILFPAALLVLCGGASGFGGHDLKRNGGTRLVYEVDDDLRPENYSLDDLAAASRLAPEICLIPARRICR
jgi:hypothetical protein